MTDEFDDTVIRYTHPALAEELAGVRTLERVLDWMKRTNRPLGSIDLVTQDEYCHDLLVPLEGGEWLVYGMT